MSSTSRPSSRRHEVKLDVKASSGRGAVKTRTTPTPRATEQGAGHCRHPSPFGSSERRSSPESGPNHLHVPVGVERGVLHVDAVVAHALSEIDPLLLGVGRHRRLRRARRSGVAAERGNLAGAAALSATGGEHQHECSAGGDGRESESGGTSSISWSRYSWPTLVEVGELRVSSVRRHHASVVSTPNRSDGSVKPSTTRCRAA